MNWNIACENTAKALSMMVENSYFAQREFKDQGLIANKGVWKEYCTIRLCTSRRCGHTTAIAKVATEYFDHAFFLSLSCDISNRLNQAIVKELYAQKEPRKLYKVTNSLIYGEPTPDNLVYQYNMSYHFHGANWDNFDSHFRGFSTQAIFVDCASFMSKNVEEKVYRDLGPSMSGNDYQFFIFVQ